MYLVFYLPSLSTLANSSSGISNALSRVFWASLRAVFANDANAFVFSQELILAISSAFLYSKITCCIKMIIYDKIGKGYNDERTWVFRRIYVPYKVLTISSDAFIFWQFICLSNVSLSILKMTRYIMSCFTIEHSCPLPLY